MTQNDQNEGGDYIFVLRPYRHAVVCVSCNRPEIYTFVTDVRNDRLMLAKPIAEFPKIWLKVYNAWQLTSVVTLSAIELIVVLQ